MSMDKPTQEQIREFWEWCGVIPIVDTRSKSGKPVVFRLDLNNLFKYAVPKLKDIGYTSSLYQWEVFEATILSDTDGYGCGTTEATVEHEDPALALFWAIWEVKE